MKNNPLVKVWGVKSLLVCLALLFSPGVRADYVQVMSMDELVDGGDYVITSSPSLTEGCMLGDQCEDDAIPGIMLDEETAESDYVVWNITFRSRNKYGLSLNGSALGVSGGHLLLGLTSSDDVGWTVAMSDKGEDGAFEFSHSKASNNCLSILTAANYTTYEWKLRGTGTKTPYLYLFKHVDIDAPRFLTTDTQFGETIDVEIEAAEDCDIYYTTDGTTPTAEAILYDGPITLDTTVTIKAVAVRGDEVSAVAEQTYTYCPPIVVNVGGSDRLGTLYSAYAVAIPDGVSVYVIESIDEAEGALQLASYAPATGVLPADVPFIIRGGSDGASSYVFNFSSGEAGEVPSYAADVVRGTAERIPLPTSGQVLALGYGADGISFGFFPYEDEMMAANRVFLVIPAATTYLRVDEEADYVSGAQYVLASACTDGQPSGYYAGAFDSNKLTAVLFDDDAEPYMYTLTGSISKLTVTDEQSRKISAAGNNDTNLSVNGTRNEWALSFTDEGDALLVNAVSSNRKLSYYSSNGDFKNYASTMKGTLYLFRKNETSTADAQAYTFRWPGAATAIRPASLPEGEDVYYDLQGRRVDKPGRGVYIHRGEKVYMK